MLFVVVSLCVRFFIFVMFVFVASRPVLVVCVIVCDCCFDCVCDVLLLLLFVHRGCHCLRLVLVSVMFYDCCVDCVCDVLWLLLCLSLVVVIVRVL